MIELQFSVQGSQLASDHGYALYGAVSRALPELHRADFPIRIGPIRGAYVGNGMLQLDRFSLLRLRLPAEQIPVVLSLAGKSLDVAACKLRLGVPQVRALVPAPNLIARLVIIKAKSAKKEPAKKKSPPREATRRYLDPAAFLEGVRKQLAELELTQAEPSIPLVRAGPHAGKPTRHVLRIHDRKIIGFSLLVQGLTADESIRLQEAGLGGRGKMGCGWFVPCRGGQS